MHGKPPLPGFLITVLVLTGRMQDGNANPAVGVDVGMPHWREEAHLRWLDGILFRETKPSSEEATLVKCVRRTDNHDLPLEEIVIIDEAC